MPDEGPPPDFNVTDTLGEHWPQAEIDVLRTALRDGVARKQLSDCRELLDHLATRLTSEELLRELSGIPLRVGRSAEELSSGVFWFALAGNLDKREGAVPVTPLDGKVDLPFPLKVQMTVQGSHVLRLYIALVYLREGVLAELIAASARVGDPCSNRVKTLLNLDFARRVRNALSHGSFLPCLAGLVFRGEKGTVLATSGFLSWLCTGLMLIQLQALAAGTTKPRVT